MAIACLSVLEVEEASERKSEVMDIPGLRLRHRIIYVHVHGPCLHRRIQSLQAITDVVQQVTYRLHKPELVLNTDNLF
jgi:hypothetical protein